MVTDLSKILTPQLYQLMVSRWLPFSKSEPIDFGQAIDTIFNHDIGNVRPLRPELWPVLKALSELGLDNVPDMMTFLPPVEDPAFPEQALGLQLVLDQAPRAFLEGVDVRYTYGYFGEISIKYSQQLRSLPEHLCPSSWSRWKDKVSVDYFVLSRLWWGAPIVHHERMGQQAVEFTNATREFVERHYGVQDPHREAPEKRWDMYGFPKMLERIAAGEPQKPCGVADGWFFLACLMDVHFPPLEKFGRYPYQNSCLGRVPTPGEEEWMEKAGMFRELPPDDKNKIREDVENGRWTPLGAGNE